MFSEFQIQRDFKGLAKAIAAVNASVGFETEQQGQRHNMKAEEFMWMNANDTEVFFKHRDTRNYVVFSPATGRLRIPKTSLSFNRGYFDSAVLESFK